MEKMHSFLMETPVSLSDVILAGWKYLQLFLAGAIRSRMSHGFNYVLELLVAIP